MTSGSSISLERLRKCIRTHPIIDHHAHNLLSLENMISEDLLSITSEASDKALQATRTTLPHRRAAKQLRELYRLPPKTTWDDIVEARTAKLDNDLTGYIKTCLAGIETILVDDGFDDPEVLEPYQWLSQFTRSPCKRILRIDTVAEDILVDMANKGELPLKSDSMMELEENCRTAWRTFDKRFRKSITCALDDTEVVAFKSGICFSTGLDVSQIDPSQRQARAFTSFQTEYLPQCRNGDFNLSAKDMSDTLLYTTCNLIAGNDQVKPLQFHTGFGGSNIRIPLSNAALLQPVIETYPTIPIVLLHASYPYVREAALLTTLYANVHLDLSAVFPEVSRHGQEEVLRQCLEIVPWEKLLWSTDGHSHPETFWLANLQGREALERVFCELMLKEDLEEDEAVEAVKGILFGNANKLYEIGLAPQRG